MNRDDRDTRYYLEIDADSKKLVSFGLGNRFELSNDDLPDGTIRIYITKGQFKKLELIDEEKNDKGR